MVQLNVDDIEWYQKEFPGATISWVISALFSKFRGVHQLTPADYIKVAAENIKEEIEGL